MTFEIGKRVYRWDKKCGILDDGNRSGWGSIIRNAALPVSVTIKMDTDGKEEEILVTDIVPPLEGNEL